MQVVRMAISTVVRPAMFMAVLLPKYRASEVEMDQKGRYLSPCALVAKKSKTSTHPQKYDNVIAGASYGISNKCLKTDVFVILSSFYVIMKKPNMMDFLFREFTAAYSVKTEIGNL